MLKYQNTNENLKEYQYIFSIGNHTTSGIIEVRMYKENYILELLKRIKSITKQPKRYKIKRLYNMDAIKRLNNKLSEYIKQQIIFHEELNCLEFINEDQVTLEQLRQVTGLASENGKHGSKTYLDYEDVREIIYHYESVLRILEKGTDNLGMIAI